MTVLIILAVWAALAVLALGLGSASAYADQQITRMNHLRGSGEEPVPYIEGTPMSESEDFGTTPEPDVRVPFPAKYGAPPCPLCGYRCGCCCYCECQTPCSTPDEDGDCGCDEWCHGGHEPWDCLSFVTRYRWARAKAETALSGSSEGVRSDGG